MNLNDFDSTRSVLGAPSLRHGKKWPFKWCLRGFEGAESVMGVYCDRIRSVSGAFLPCAVLPFCQMAI